MRFSGPVQPPPPPPRPKTNWAAALITLVVVLIGLSISLSRLDKSPSVQEASSSRLHQPPYDIADRCSKTFLATPGGWETCQFLCHASECCFLPAEMSCREDSSVACELYAPCKVYFADGADITEVPPAPDDIANICSSERVVTIDGFTECESVCFRAECCAAAEASGKSCKNTHKEVCAEYDPCKTLKSWNGGGKDKTYGGIDPGLMKAMIDETCKKEMFDVPEDFNDCKAMCSSKMCCFQEGSDSCKDDKHGTYDCSVYDSCKILLTYEKKEPVEDGEAYGNIDPGLMKAMIDETCNNEMFDVPEDFNDCKAMCSSRVCCFAEGSDSCKDDKKGTYDCSVYDSCKVLLNYWNGEPIDDDDDNDFEVYGGIDPGFKDDEEDGFLEEQDIVLLVDMACTDELIATPSGRKACRNLCERNSCCISKTCSDESDCDQFKPCEILVADENNDEKKENSKVVDVGVEPGLMKGMIDETCRKEMFDVPEDLNNCEFMCEESMCCFAEGSNRCENGEKYSCAIYDSCQVLLSYGNEETEIEDEKGSLNIQDDNLEELRSIITETCDVEVFEVPDDIKICEEMCKKGTCCFAEGSKSCKDDNRCSAYDACQILFIEDI